MKINRKFRNGSLALALALVLAGCSSDNAKQTLENTETKVEEKAESIENTVEGKTDAVEESIENKVDDLKSGLEAADLSISLDDAVAKFRETFNSPDVHISSVELDRDDGKYTYEIQGFDDGNEYDAEIDANTGEALSKEVEQDDLDDDDIAIDFVSIISPEDAVAKALENNTGYVESYELGYDDGRLTYEIDIEDGDDVELDAQSGDILEK